MELKEILERHKHWINEDVDGWEDMRANMSGADLREANLREANMSGADLRGAENVPFVPMACPSHGSFTAFKKARGGLIVELLIPEDARRFSGAG